MPLERARLRNRRSPRRPRRPWNSGGYRSPATSESSIRSPLHRMGSITSPHPGGRQPHLLRSPSTGDLHVASLDNDSAVYPDSAQIRYLRKPSGQSWSTPELLYYTHPLSRYSMALSPVGVIHLLNVNNQHQL